MSLGELRIISFKLVLSVCYCSSIILPATNNYKQKVRLYFNVEYVQVIIIQEMRFFALIKTF